MFLFQIYIYTFNRSSLCNELSHFSQLYFCCFFLLLFLYYYKELFSSSGIREITFSYCFFFFCLCPLEKSAIFYTVLSFCMLGRWVEDHEVVHNIMFNTTTNEKVFYKKALNRSEWWDNGVLPLWITAQNQVNDSVFSLICKLYIFDNR